VTLAMPDSVTVSDLPDGYPAYLGYADGLYQTAADLAARFPAAHRVILTVTGMTLDADGIDCEPANPNARQSVEWAGHKLAAAPGSRPPIYASVIGTPGYGMADVLHELAAQGILRSAVRLLTAHYAWKSGLYAKHICGPGSCGLLSVDADGTQWTDTYIGVNGHLIDMSVLRDDFFAAAPPAPQPPVTQWTEFDMAKLPVLRQGAADSGPGFWYVHRLQDLVQLTGALNSLPPAKTVAVDGVFGPATDAGVRAVQSHYRIAVDGVAGAQTWGVLLTGSPA
jgi:peptidoglycan hydrolase-like protein with peptidoglycan-binding domain